jgi:hypothetical protein
MAIAGTTKKKRRKEKISRCQVKKENDSEAK